jgi:hypothetical protein
MRYIEANISSQEHENSDYVFHDLKWCTYFNKSELLHLSGLQL